MFEKCRRKNAATSSITALFSILREYFLLVHRRFLLFLIMNKRLLSSIIYYNFSTITIAFLTSFLVLEFKRKLPVFSSDSFPFILILLGTSLLPTYSSLYPKDHIFLSYLFHGYVYSNSFSISVLFKTLLDTFC